MCLGTPFTHSAFTASYFTRSRKVPSPEALPTWFRNIDLWAITSRFIFLAGDGSKDSIYIRGMFGNIGTMKILTQIRQYPTETGTEILENDILMIQARRDLESPYAQELKIGLTKVIPMILRDIMARAKRPGDDSRVGDLISQYQNAMVTLELDLERDSIRYFPGYEDHHHSCYYENCMCSHKQPLHSLRVCKGCWRVLYCGKRCQVE